MIRSTTRSQWLRAAGAAAVLSVTTLVSGCAVFSPVQTDKTYQPADGVSMNLGPVTLRDLVIVAEAKGGPGTLSGQANNPTDKPVTIAFSAEGGQETTFTLKPYTSGPISNPDGESPRVTLPSVPAAPGAVVRYTIAAAVAGTGYANVPIMLPDGIYEGLKPSPTPTETATPSATPSTSATP